MSEKLACSLNPLSGKAHRSQDDVRTMSASVLAYIGDAVFELYVRTFLVDHFDGGSGKLHGHGIQLVCAEAQADYLKELNADLTDVEANIVRRARNEHPRSMPRHANPVTYRYATAFEALIGYLWLTGQFERINTFCINILEKYRNEQSSV